MAEEVVSRPATMADVGAIAGVTSRTVSNVLSGKVAVSPQTQAAVLQAVDQLGYRMNTAARHLRTGRTGTITLALPDLSVDYFSQLASAVAREADRHGWAVTLEQTNYQRERELQVLLGQGKHLSDGLIIQPYALQDRDVDVLVANQPCILLGDHAPGLPIDHITMANTDAARYATQHLLQTGHRRIAAVGVNSSGGPHTAEALRLRGYEAALEAAGMTLDPKLLAAAGRWRLQDGAAAVEGLLSRGVRFDALFCFNDSLALGAMHVLSEHGIRVPHDVAVIGFDDIAAAAYSNPPLTTINPGGTGIAAAAVQALSRRLELGPSGPAVGTVQDFHLVIRSSA